MGVRFPSVAVVGSGPITVTAAVESAILTTPGLNPPFDFSQIYIGWYVDLTEGTAGTAFQVRIRRGVGVLGAIVFVSLAIPLAAGANGSNGGMCIDTSPGAVAGQQYTLTVQQTAATGNGSVSSCDLLAFVL